MKCLSIRQPWANLIITNQRNLEVRSWETSFRGNLLVHAGQTIEQNVCERLKVDPNPTGAILGYTRLDDIEKATVRKWTALRSKHLEKGPRCYGNDTRFWHVNDSYKFDEPIEYKGRLGLFNVPDEILPWYKNVLVDINPETLREILPKICKQETSLDANGWTNDNPLWGHCAVVSLLAQNLFGGELMRASLEGTQFSGSHYWNNIPEFGSIDFTADQFGSNYPKGLKAIMRDRDYVLSYQATKDRYKLLALRLAREIHNGNPIFNDPIYRKCFENALDAKCKKMWFGLVITHNGKVVYEGHNKEIEELKSLCDPKCIRFQIQSRTDGMLGACGHAEELGLWEVARKGIPLDECELYIAGLYPNGLPWLKKEPEHTCLRCTVQMNNAKIKTVYVPVVDRWAALTPSEALETAKAYALKKKTAEELAVK